MYIICISTFLFFFYHLTNGILKLRRKDEIIKIYDVMASNFTELLDNLLCNSPYSTELVRGVNPNEGT